MEPVVEHPFLFLGGDVALDFVSTVVVDGDGPVDRLPTPADLASWVAVSGLGREYGVPAGIAPTVHATAIALRRALEAAFDAVAAGEPVPDEAVAPHCIDGPRRSGCRPVTLGPPTAPSAPGEGSQP